MRSFYKFLAETTGSKNVDFILRHWNHPDPKVRQQILNDPQLKQQILKSLWVTQQSLSNTTKGIDNPYYLEIILSLDEILPQLMKIPEFSRVARDVHQLIQVDKAQMGI